jgi:F-type H+-transporting ATPase subunit b
MLRAWTAAQPLLLSLALLLSAGAAGRAEDKTAPGPVKYEAEVHDPATHKPTTKVFDLSKAEDKAELEKAVSGGHVHSLHVKEELTLKKLFSLAGDLGLWTIVVFVLLFLVLNKFAFPKMIAGLHKREERIRGALDEAQKAKDEAHAIRTSLQKQMDEAADRVRGIIDEARRDAQDLREQEMAKTRAEIQGERERLHREIETETDQALQRIWSQAAELATQVSAKALGRGITEDGHRRLIDEAVAELRTAATQGANGNA